MAAERNGRKRRRRKRCRHCSELVDPDPRVGDRQDYCSLLKCQRARKSAYQRRYRERHPAEDRERRLRSELAQVKAGRSPPAPRPREPLGLIPWEEINTELGGPTAVVLRCVLGIVIRWLARSSGGREPPDIVDKSRDRHVVQ